MCFYTILHMAKKVNHFTRERDLLIQRDLEVVRLYNLKRREIFQSIFNELFENRKKTMSDVELTNYILQIYNIEEKAVDAVFDCPVSRFWMSPEQAAKIISLYQRHVYDYTSDKTRERNKLIYSLYKELKTVKSNKSIAELAVEIVERPAPCFFIGKEKIKQIISNEKRKK